MESELSCWSFCKAHTSSNSRMKRYGSSPSTPENLASKTQCFKDTVLAILVSSSFKIFLIATMIWEFPSSVLYINDIVVLSSNTVAFKVFGGDDYWGLRLLRVSGGSFALSLLTPYNLPTRKPTGNRLLLALGMSADEAQPQRPKALPRLRDFTDKASPWPGINLRYQLFL
ncbi:hypothetical protein AgCh_009898 [Apium graveolens]